MKSVCIRSFSGPYFLSFGLNTKRYRVVSLRIQSECGKIRTRCTPNTDTFHEVIAYRKSKLLSDYFMKNDSAKQQLDSQVSTCRKCKFCLIINTAKLITNVNLNIIEKNWKLQGSRSYLRLKMLKAQSFDCYLF